MKDLSKAQSKLSPVVKEFRTTPSMFIWLDKQIELATDVIDEIARQSGVNESSWYNWKKMPGFEDWYWGEYDKRVRRWKPLVDSLGVKFAKKGSDKHFEYLARRVGNITNGTDQTGIKKRIVAEEFFE